MYHIVRFLKRVWTNKIAWFYERYKIKHIRQITFQNNFCDVNLDSVFTNLFLCVLKTNVIDKIIFVPCENIALEKKTNMKSPIEQISYTHKWKENFIRAIILNKTLFRYVQYTGSKISHRSNLIWFNQIKIKEKKKRQRCKTKDN